ncbi:hypothetical protein E3O55_01635 [Cryobacterium sp. MDB1-18-2]|uniref:DUF6049 family protein n=1 Tax=unclassified Cryobacterium TaxID=2649013 RepID=UPI00106BAA14|nr:MULTISPECIES: DUF6049 family protein [unclassified Cryobacterium]TFC35229.1 hypothetical protein E3O55_01635 [Cryobacterium sp. MDB1-18-2]TFC45010.1 hypothetical protein E3O50_03780 [Cryobacterium sp. MDB1-18-1]
MVAESSTARRPAHPTAASGRWSHLRVPVSALLIGILAGLLPLASSGFIPGAPTSAAAAATATATPTPTPTPTADAATTDQVTVTVAPVSLAPLRSGQDLAVTVRITNGSAETITPGTIELYLAERALTSRSALTAWLHPTKTGKPGDLMLRSALPAAIPPAGTATVAISVPSADVGLTSGNAWGARGISATITEDGSVLAQGRGTFVWYSNEVVTPVALAVVMPITVPEQTEGLIPAKSLETYTAPGGRLSRQLDGVINRDVTIAIDPMIIASIRILGNTAPASAVAWLGRLGQAKNDIFPLGYADADLTLQAQAAAGTLLVPLSFDQSINASDFTSPTPAPTPSTSTPTPTPTPTATGSAPAGLTDTTTDTTTDTATPTPPPTSAPVITPGTVPTSEQLLAWNYTATDIGWPLTGTVSAADLDVFTAGGLSSLILGGANTAQSDLTETPNANVVLAGGHGNALVTDEPISAALRTAATATTDSDWQVAMAELSSQIAVVSAERPATVRTLLATFDRDTVPGGVRLSETLAALSGLGWRAPATVAAARAASPATDVSFQSQAVSDARILTARTLLHREGEVTAFSTALSKPLAITATQRLTTLALLSTSWAQDTGAWSEAVDSSLADSSVLLSSISVSTKGPINVVGSQVDIPITLDNALGQSVTVKVQVVPSNGRLIVGGDVIEATIEASSARTVKVPVTAAVGNGAVTLRITLFSPDGSVVGQPSQIPINVRADWEGLGSLIFAALLVLFFGFGIWRNVQRRRRERTAVAQATDAPVEPPVDPPVVPRG